MLARVGRYHDNPPYAHRRYGYWYGWRLYSQRFWYRGLSIQTPPGNGGSRKLGAGTGALLMRIIVIHSEKPYHEQPCEEAVKGELIQWVYRWVNVYAGELSETKTFQTWYVEFETADDLLAFGMKYHPVIMTTLDRIGYDIPESDTPILEIYQGYLD